MKRVSAKLFAALVLFGAPQAVSAEQATAAQRCLAPNGTAAVAGERQAVRGNHRFDRLPQGDQKLAAFTPVASQLRGVIRRVDIPGGEKLVALTFDLCEQYGEVAGYDGDIFDYLRAQGVPATIFAGGKWLRSHPARTEQLISDPLFEMANHAEAHRNLRLLDGPGRASEINGPQISYERARGALSASQCLRDAPQALNAIPDRLKLFRFPYGACNPDAIAAVNDAGLLAIQWDLSSGDPDPRIGAEALAAGVMHRVKPGSIVVMHGNGRGWHTAEALPLLIPKLKERGYKFLTVSQLLARGTPVVTQACYDSKPGDTDRYDHPISLTAVGKSQSTSKATGKPSGPGAPQQRPQQ